MKKSIGLLTIIFTLTILLTFAVSADELSYIEANGVKLYNLSSTKVEGYINLQGETTKSKLKLMVVHNNEQLWYDIKLQNGKFNEQLWLNKGIGEYNIYVMVNEYDRKYSYGPKVTIENCKEINPLLSPDKHVESADKPIMDKAAELTKGLSGDREKAEAIYRWVAQNVKYDYDKYNKHKNNNYDNEYGALYTLNIGKGVCYDYSTLVAALGRASGLQTKLIKGTGTINGTSGYHAWNEIYIAGENKWIKLDATFASVSGENYFDSENFDEHHVSE